MSDYTVVRDWTTKAGFRAVITMGIMGFHCGYVGLPAGHPLYGCEYGEPCDALAFPVGETVGKRGIIPLLCADGEARPDVVFDVHGSLTYSGSSETYPVPHDGLWWFGYDCGHSGDGRSDAYIAGMKAAFPNKPFMWFEGDGVFRDLDYCVAECESLAQQMADRIKAGDA